MNKKIYLQTLPEGVFFKEPYIYINAKCILVIPILQYQRKVCCSYFDAGTAKCKIKHTSWAKVAICKANEQGTKTALIQN